MSIVSVKHVAKSSFAQASKEAGAGYSDPNDAAHLIPWKADAKPAPINLPEFFGPFYAALAIAYLRRPERPLHVVDFGGQTGDYLDYVTAAFGETLKTQWSVIETQPCVDFARKWSNPAVSFHASLDAIETPIDFAMFSSVLFYLPDWKAPLEHRRVREAEHIFITRTPFAEAEAPFVQTVTYTDKVSKRAARILPRGELFNSLNRTHELFASWQLQMHLGALGLADSPSMLWRRRPTA